MIPLKFYRDDEYVYINNPDGTTRKVAIEDFESAISGDGGGIPPTRSVVYNSFQNKLFFSDTYEDVTYDDLNRATAYNQIVNLRWTKSGVGTLNGYLAKLVPAVNNAVNNCEAYFIILDDINIPTVIKFNATGSDKPLKVTIKE